MEPKLGVFAQRHEKDHSRVAAEFVTGGLHPNFQPIISRDRRLLIRRSTVRRSRSIISSSARRSR